MLRDSEYFDIRVSAGHREGIEKCIDIKRGRERNHQGTDSDVEEELMELGLEFVPERMVVGDGAVIIRKADAAARRYF